MIQSANEYILATRKSPLAMAQSNLVVSRFEAMLAGTRYRIEKMVTTGDRQSAWSLSEKGGKGLFTKELEDALLDGRADFAVHSAKDLPSEMPAGLALAGFLPREATEDVLVLRDGIGTPSTIATGSPRRRLQLRYLFPRATFCEIRGNVDTRLNKIVDGAADGTALAAAGLKRLGIAEWKGLTFRTLTLDECVPAVGQAAIAIQCRLEDVPVFAPALDEPTRIAVTLERAFLQRLGGGCQVAFAVNYTAGKLRLYHTQCGRELRDVPESYAESHHDLIAKRLIEQLELTDG